MLFLYKCISFVVVLPLRGPLYLHRPQWRPLVLCFGNTGRFSPVFTTVCVQFVMFRQRNVSMDVSTKFSVYIQTENRHRIRDMTVHCLCSTCFHRGGISFKKKRGHTLVKGHKLCRDFMSKCYQSDRGYFNPNSRVRYVN